MLPFPLLFLYSTPLRVLSLFGNFRDNKRPRFDGGVSRYKSRLRCVEASATTKFRATVDVSLRRLQDTADIRGHKFLVVVAGESLCQAIYLIFGDRSVERRR